MESPKTDVAVSTGRGRRRFWIVLALVIGSLLCALPAAVYLGYVRDIPLEVSPETTVITEPLMSDGRRVDYFLAAERMIYPPELATEDNGFRMVVAALGASPDHTLEERLQLYQKLGLDPGPAPTLTYEEPYDVITRYLDAEEAAGRLADLDARTDLDMELTDLMDRPWTFADLPMMEDWLNDNSAALDVIAQAVRKPVFRVPWTREDEETQMAWIPLNEIQLMRGFARGFAARARFRLASGDIQGAIDDIISCARLGRHLQGPGGIIENLVGIACEAIALGIGLGSSLEHQPTEEQWRRFLSELNDLPAAGDGSVALEFERYALLDVMQLMSISGVIRGMETMHMAARDLTALMQGRSFGIDWNIVMHRTNENYDRNVRGIDVASPYPGAMEGIMTRAQRSRLVADSLSTLFMPAVHQFKEALLRRADKENLLRIVLAMLLYEKEHGTLPPAYSVDEQGNPLHSWRVLLLPYLGYDELYAQLRLDETWDSPHNQAFHTAEVPIYQCPSASLSPGMTEYSVVEGETCAFFGSEGKRLDEFGEHSANLVLVAERLFPVCWMDPTQELTFAEACLGINRDAAATGLGSEHVGGMHIGLRSGAVRFVSENIDLLHIPALLEGTMSEAF